MFSSDGLSSLASQEFVMLCQAQILLVQQAFQVDWSGVYLTRSPMNTDDPELIPIVLYPQTDTNIDPETGLINLSRRSRNGSFELQRFLPFSGDSMEVWDLDEMIPYSSENKIRENLQLVFPLVYQEEMLGVLVAGRETSQWQTEEIAQLENIACTLAIACFLDQQKSWYLQQLKQQQIRHQWERDLLDDLFHQLRNPLTALRTFSKLLLKRFWGDEKTRSVIEGIGRESYHLQELLQSFEGDLAQTDTEMIIPTVDKKTLQENTFAAFSPFLLPSSTLSLTSIFLQDILEPILLSEQAIAQEKQIQINTFIANDLPTIFGNAAALREILSNLIDNALKYTRSGGEVRVTLGLTCAEEPNLWQGVEIADTGYGIPQEDQDHIFERHYRGIQSQGDIPGTGLGLAIVKELVEKIQGKIEIISPNKLSENPEYLGTTFIVWLLLENKKVNN